MKHPRLTALVLALFPLVTVVAAQTEDNDPMPAPTRAQKERIISKEISSALSSGIKYQPPTPLKSTAEDIDPRDSDKSQNGIIRLPRYVVEEQRPPVFNERNLYTPERLRRLAYLRYTNAFSRKLRLVPEWYAVMQYEAEERRRNMAEMEDKVSMYRVSGDDASAKELKDDTQRSFMRRTEYIATPNTGK